jgi:hypothetical protein
LAASKKWEKEREKEAKKIKKKEEKDRRRRSKSEKKKKKKDKATATTNATTGDQPPFALQPPATLQADGTALLPPSVTSRPVVAHGTRSCAHPSHVIHGALLHRVELFGLHVLERRERCDM